MLPDKLYHGTNQKCLDAILLGGLRPRGSRRRANDQTFSSSSKHVYLSREFAIKFAFDGAETMDKACYVIEVDRTKLDPGLFCADDDLVVAAMRRDPALKDLSERTMISRAQRDLHLHCPELSLKHSGSCAYKGIIPASAFTRVAEINIEHQKWWLWGASDVGTGPTAYRYTRGRHQTRMAWLFDGVNEVKPDNWPADMDWTPFRQTPLTRKGVTVFDGAMKTVLLP